MKEFDKEKILATRDVGKSLFYENDYKGSGSLKADIDQASSYFRLEQPKLVEEIDFADRIERLHKNLGIDTKIVAEQFMAETKRLLDLIKSNNQIFNIARGVYLPVVLPKLPTDDLGDVLELYLEGVGQSYRETFRSRDFNNYCQGDLSGNVHIVEISRQGQLIKRMRKESVIGLYFPNSLQCYSIDEAIKETSTLPEGLILSGMDIAIAMAMYPDILAYGWKAPGLELASLAGKSSDYSFSFKADDDGLDFNCTGSHSYHAGFSSSFLFLD